MAIYVIPEEDWKALDTFSDAIKDVKNKLVEKWEELGARYGFIPQTAAPWDEEKRAIEAEPIPEPDYIRRKQAVMILDAVHKLDPEDRKIVAELMDYEPKIPLAKRVEFLQDGATIKDAVLAEATPVEKSEGVIKDGNLYKPNAEGELVNMGPASEYKN